MTKLSISLAVTAAALLATAGCERNEIKREAEDVVDAREDVQEEKQELREEVTEQQQEVQEEQRELQEEKAELALEIQEQMNEAQKRFDLLDEKAMTVTKTLDTSTGVGAEIHQAHMLAKAKLEAARNAKTADEVQTALNEAKDAIDKLEDKLEDYSDQV